MAIILRSALILIVLVFSGCRDRIIRCSNRVNERIPLFLGETHFSRYRSERDSFRHLPLPPPPDQTIGNVNVFEAPGGKVFSYSFKPKQPLCGYMSENGKYVFEIYKDDLDSLKSASLKEIELQNVDTFINGYMNVNLPDKLTMLSVGIVDSNSTNPILLKICNVLYDKDYRTIWKVRKTFKQELRLVQQH